jgi:hypothetical protein
MIHLQIIDKDDARIQSLLRNSIQAGSIKSFQVVQVKGGIKVKQAKYLGSLKFAQKKHILFGTLQCNNQAKEWQLLEAFIGRLTYHFKDYITAINL